MKAIILGAAVVLTLMLPSSQLPVDGSWLFTAEPDHPRPVQSACFTFRPGNSGTLVLILDTRRGLRTVSMSLRYKVHGDLIVFTPQDDLNTEAVEPLILKGEIDGTRLLLKGVGDERDPGVYVRTAWCSGLANWRPPLTESPGVY